ncbi:MAG: hypothetical protein AB8B64_18975 [Granulosicoccus sp.]
MNSLEKELPSYTFNLQSAEAMRIGLKIYWVVVAATVTNYLTMVLWSLPLISEMAGGSVPFDMRPGGYSLDDARAFLTAITDEGRDFYLNTQQYLDWFYPTLMAITIAIPLACLVPRYWGWALAALAIAAGALDHLENSAVAVMLRVEPDALTEAMVSTASNWSLAKSISTTIALVALLLVLCIKGVAWLKTRQAQAR